MPADSMPSAALMMQEYFLVGVRLMFSLLTMGDLLYSRLILGIGSWFLVDVRLHGGVPHPCPCDGCWFVVAAA
jgi:hypothetical protein